MDIKKRHHELKKLLFDQYVYVHVRTANPGVLLPPDLYNEPIVTLVLSKFFRGSCNLEDDYVTAELRFGEDYFTCTIPLSAICGVTTHSGATQPWEAVRLNSEELTESSPTKKRAPVTSSKSGASSKSHLKRVK